jgi:hypothetical protein
MEKCLGCGQEVGASWKFCIHCGLAVHRTSVPAAIRFDDSMDDAPAKGAVSRGLVIGGIGIFLLGVALIVIAFAFFSNVNI